MWVFVEDHAGVAVLRDAGAGPVLAGDQDGFAVDDDALVVDVVLEFDALDDVQSGALEQFEVASGSNWLMMIFTSTPACWRATTTAMRSARAADASLGVSGSSMYWNCM